MNKCSICGGEKSKHNKTCGSKKCISSLISTQTKGKNGGIRAGSGRSKSGFYKGIYCNSTYELVWVVYRLDHDLPVQRFDGYILYDKNKKYYPDFLVDGDVIIEIKGYHTDIVDDKVKAAENNGYKVVVKYLKDLSEEFKWAISKYETYDFESLYDDHIPKFLYTCNQCNKPFGTFKKRKTSIVFCSRECSGKGHLGHGNELGKNQYT